VFAIYTILSIARYERFASRSWDLAIFDVAVRQYANLHAPIVGIKGPEFNLLGDHFSPLLAILAPIYRLFPSAVTLLIAQAGLIAVSVVPVSRLAIRHLGTAKGLGVACSYGLSWGLVQAVDSDFHEVCLAVPLLALALEAYVNGRWRSSAAWALPMVLVKEDLGLTVAVLGGCIALRGQRRLGAALAGFGVAATAATVGLIMPAISDQSRYTYWDALVIPRRGHSPLALAEHLLSPSVKLVTLALLFATTGFLALRSTLSLLAVPTLLWRFLASSPTFWGWDWHYNAILMPIIFVALIDAVVLTRTSERPWLRVYGAQVALAVVLPVAVGLAGQLPLRHLISPTTYRTDTRVAHLRAGLALIPSGATVEAGSTVLAHLASRCTVYLFGQPNNPTPDYIAVDVAATSSPIDAAANAEKLHPEATYTLVYQSREFLVVAHRNQ
jgi:uncharacterized membrane protein